MNTTEQINALVEKYSLSETVKQEIVKIAENEYNEGYGNGYESCINKEIIWKNAKKQEPNYDNINYLVIIKIGNNHVYSFAYWDSEKWINTNIESVEVIAFTETDPKYIVNQL